MIDDLKRIAEDMSTANVDEIHAPLLDRYSDRLTAWIEKWGPFVEASKTLYEQIPSWPQSVDAMRAWLEAYSKAMEKP
jgi:hypothetical protein